MKLIFSIIFLLSGIIVASESAPIRAAVQTGREAEAKAINETDTEAKALMADFLHLSPDLLRREAVDTSSCKDLIPGMKRFQCGVDGARLDLIRLEQGKDDGYKSPIVYYTCEEGKKTKIGKTGKMYDEPDQIEGIAAINAGFSSNKADIMKTRSDVSKFISVNAGIGDKLGLFKLSSSYSKMTAMVDEKKKSLASTEHIVTAFAANMIPFISLQTTPSVEKYIEERLKNTFQEDPDPYREFIRQWGTHFFHKANFGGLIRVLMEMDSSFAKNQTQHTIGVQASGIIKGIKLSAGFKSEDKTMNSDFQKHTSVSKTILGGNYSTFLNKGFNAWQTTVAKSPWLYKGKLMSIDHLFKDAKKGKEMHKAIKEHMMKAQLEAAMKQAKKKLSSIKGKGAPKKEKKLQSYIDRCDELIINGFPKENEVKELNRQIEEAMLWQVKVEYGIFDGMQEAINGVKDMKKRYGTGVSTQIVVGNLLSDKLEYTNQKTRYGRWQNKYLVEIPAGKWLGCLHVKESWKASGSQGWIEWKNGKMLYYVGWKTPWWGKKGFGMEIKEGNQKSPKSWTNSLRSKTVIPSPDGTTQMTGWFDMNQVSTRVIFKISKVERN